MGIEIERRFIVDGRDGMPWRSGFHIVKGLSFGMVIP